MSWSSLRAHQTVDKLNSSASLSYSTSHREKFSLNYTKNIDIYVQESEIQETEEIAEI